MKEGEKCKINFMLNSCCAEKLVQKLQRESSIKCPEELFPLHLLFSPATFTSQSTQMHVFQ